MTKVTTNDFYREHYENAKEKRKEYQRKRKEKRGVITVELSHWALAALAYLAGGAGESRAAYLNRTLERLAEKHGIPEPMPVSQLVTTKENAPIQSGRKRDAVKDALNDWGDD